MKRLFTYLLIAATIFVAGCSEAFDDSAIWDSINSLEQRGSAMETVMKAYENNLFIESVKQIDNGYVITFSDGSQATIVNGKDEQDGKDGNTYITSIVIGENEVTFTLTDGKSFSIPIYPALYIEFAESDLVVMSPNSTREIGYTVSSMTEKVTMEVTSSADIKAKVVADDASGKSGKIHIATSATIDEYSKVVVFVSNDEKVIMRSISFEEAGLVVEDSAIKQATAEGGEVVLEFLSNVECEVVIPEDAQSWISVVPATRAMEKQTITLKLEPNEGYYRSTTVIVQSLGGTLKLEYLVEQDGDLGINVDPMQIPDNEVWYRTINCEAIEIFSPLFDATIVSNKYESGLGKIVCKSKITRILESAFLDHGYMLSELYLPDCVETLECNALSGIPNISKLYIPQNLKNIDLYAMRWSGPFTWGSGSTLKEVYGNHVTDDHRCVIIDGTVYGFAPCGLEEYAIPEGVRAIDIGVFGGNENLKSITFPNGLQRIGFGAFAGCIGLNCDIIIPNSITEIEQHAFDKCPNITGFYGPSQFVTADNKCLLRDNNIIAFAGKGLDSYVIPEGVKGIIEDAMASGTSLTSITIPNSLVDVVTSDFRGLDNLTYFYGCNVSNDNKCIVINNVLMAAVPQLPAHYVVPEGIVELGSGAFCENKTVESIVVNDAVLIIGADAFAHCPNLKRVVMPASLVAVGDWPSNQSALFLNDYNLEDVYFRSYVPPQLLYMGKTDYPKLKVYVPRETLDVYKNTPGLKLLSPYMVGYDCDDIGSASDYYLSTDYSSDRKLVTLQTATKGAGIDIILMGDAFSDRQINNGSYAEAMKRTKDAFFSEEPYKSMQDYFNVYYINVVSITEGFNQNPRPALKSKVEGVLIDGDLIMIKDIVRDAFPHKSVDEHYANDLIIVLLNADIYAGTCHIYAPVTSNGDCSDGLTISYCPLNSDIDTFRQIVHHETCGHGFAKLADEYAYENMGAVPSDYVSQFKAQQSSWGWWKNVDFTSDLANIRWSRFINDTRYASECLGAYEGGLTYWSGVWRPTENSIMRHNTGGFNAPSREAIYYRIHKLAYGDSWEYDYEEFVEWDERNRTTTATAAQRGVPYKHSSLKPTHPPVIINKSWRDAK